MFDRSAADIPESGLPPLVGLGRQADQMQSALGLLARLDPREGEIAFTSFKSGSAF